MDTVPFFITSTLCHVDEDRHELDLKVRHNGRLFYLMYHTDYFVRSPGIRAKYLEYLHEIREDEVDFQDPDTFRWLLKPFEALIPRLAPPVSRKKPPTLSQYAFPDFFRCRLDAVDENFHPKQLDKLDAPRGPPGKEIPADQLRDLQLWTRVYDPSQVILSYDRSKDVLVKPPKRVKLSNGDGENNSMYFFKSFVENCHQYQVQRELETFKKIGDSNIEAGTHISSLHGVVTTEDGRILGLLLGWIDAPKGPLAYQFWRRSLEARLRWAVQIRETVTELHKNGVVWGDAKLENILLDKDDTPWIIDFGGGYTPYYIDREKAETVEGDLQGLEKIVEKLSRSSPRSTPPPSDSSTE